jgi:ubiquinol-cytochrome c reductase cytochrome b subunit
MSKKNHTAHQNHTTSDTNNGLLSWIDRRFPLTSTIKGHLSEYYAPKNLNFWYFFGSLALLVLVIQIVSGILLVMHYKPDASLNAAGIPVAFASVEYIMREVPFGNYIRYTHSTGASAFFVVVYLHMFRGLLYGSYRAPRELIWIFGCMIFLCLMAEAFFGYLLPWGQMSFWGAQVIVNLFAAVPFIGPDLALLIRGDFVVGDSTLNRFFSFHVIAIPLVLVGLIAAHIIALHEVGSNNPDGVEIKKNKDESGKPLDGISFHPYYSVHDLMGVGVFLMAFAFVVFFVPEMGGYFLEFNNFIPADPLKTPPHIAPVWYFTPFYSMLRATTSEFLLPFWLFLAALVAFNINQTNCRRLKMSLVLAIIALALGFKIFDAKFWGVVVMGGSVIILFFLPWLDKSPVKSIRYRPKFHTYFYAIFVIAFLILGYLGVQPPSLIGERVSQFLTLVYFGFFLGMPIWSKMGKFKEEPTRVNFEPH